MERVTASQYFTALKYISENDELAFDYLKDINVLDKNNRYVGAFYKDSNCIYSLDHSKKGNYLHIADVDWQWVGNNID